MGMGLLRSVIADSRPTRRNSAPRIKTIPTAGPAKADKKMSFRTGQGSYAAASDTAMVVNNGDVSTGRLSSKGKPSVAGSSRRKHSESQSNTHNQADSDFGTRNRGATDSHQPRSITQGIHSHTLLGGKGKPDDDASRAVRQSSMQAHGPKRQDKSANGPDLFEAPMNKLTGSKPVPEARLAQAESGDRSDTGRIAGRAQARSVEPTPSEKTLPPANAQRSQAAATLKHKQSSSGKLTAGMQARVPLASDAGKRQVTTADELNSTAAKINADDSKVGDHAEPAEEPFENGESLFADNKPKFRTKEHPEPVEQAPESAREPIADEFNLPPVRSEPSSKIVTEPKIDEPQPEQARQLQEPEKGALPADSEYIAVQAMVMQNNPFSGLDGSRLAQGSEPTLLEAPATPEVKIGQIDVFIEAPQRVASRSTTGRASLSLASRQFLRRL